MLKVLFKINIIILANLLAFLLLGLILDALFGTGNTMKIACIALSLPVLGLIMYLKAGTLLSEIKNIGNTYDDGKSNRK